LFRADSSARAIITVVLLRRAPRANAARISAPVQGIGDIDFRFRAERDEMRFAELPERLARQPENVRHRRVTQVGPEIGCAPAAKQASTSDSATAILFTRFPRARLEKGETANGLWPPTARS
jgi:hypothetical protein